MISHFKLSDYENHFYLEISSIQQGASGLELAGIVGDGSAEAWFEARIGEESAVNVLPVWDAGSEALCRRYDLDLLETGIAKSFEDINFKSLRSFNRATNNWQEQIVAVAQLESSACYPVARSVRPHQWVCESAPLWQQQGVC